MPFLQKIHGIAAPSVFFNSHKVAFLGRYLLYTWSWRICVPSSIFLKARVARVSSYVATVVPLRNRTDIAFCIALMLTESYFKALSWHFINGQQVALLPCIVSVSPHGGRLLQHFTYLCSVALCPKFDLNRIKHGRVTAYSASGHTLYIDLKKKE